MGLSKASVRMKGLRAAMFAGLLLSPSLVSGQAERGLSPEFRAAAERSYRHHFADERTRYCARTSPGQNAEQSSARKAAASLRQTASDTALMSLIYRYAFTVNTWQAAVVLHAYSIQPAGDSTSLDPDCTPSRELEAVFKTCREAIEIALNGGPVAPPAVCQKSD